MPNIIDSILQSFEDFKADVSAQNSPTEEQEKPVYKKPVDTHTQVFALMNMPQEELASKVKEILKREFGDLPDRGTIAGQAVASALYEIASVGISGEFNDIDVFLPFHDPSKIWKERSDKEVVEHYAESVVDSFKNQSREKESLLDYTASIFEPEYTGLSKAKVQNTLFASKKKTSGLGAYNVEESEDFIRAALQIDYVDNDPEHEHINRVFVNYIGEAEDFTKKVLDGFDLNSVMAGINLETNEVVMSDDFINFLYSHQIKPHNPPSPIKTFGRYLNKVNSMTLPEQEIEAEMNRIGAHAAVINIIERDYGIKLSGVRFTEETLDKYEASKERFDAMFDIKEEKMPSYIDMTEDRVLDLVGKGRFKEVFDDIKKNGKKLGPRNIDYDKFMGLWRFLRSPSTKYQEGDESRAGMIRLKHIEECLDNLNYLFNNYGPELEKDIKITLDDLKSPATLLYAAQHKELEKNPIVKQVMDDVRIIFELGGNKKPFINTDDLSKVFYVLYDIYANPTKVNNRKKEDIARIKEWFNTGVEEGAIGNEVFGTKPNIGFVKGLIRSVVLNNNFSVSGYKDEFLNTAYQRAEEHKKLFNQLTKEHFTTDEFSAIVKGVKTVENRGLQSVLGLIENSSDTEWNIKELVDVDALCERFQEYEKKMLEEDKVPQRIQPLLADFGKPVIGYKGLEYVEIGGLHVREITSPYELKVLGDEMKHCVGGYFYEIQEGNTYILDVIDPSTIGTKAFKESRSTMEIGIERQVVIERYDPLCETEKITPQGHGMWVKQHKSFANCHPSEKNESFERELRMIFAKIKETEVDIRTIDSNRVIQDKNIVEIEGYGNHHYSELPRLAEKIKKDIEDKMEMLNKVEAEMAATENNIPDNDRVNKARDKFLDKFKNNLDPVRKN